MVHRIRVTQTDMAGNILPGLRPFINSADANSHPETVTIPYLNKNPHTALYTGNKCSIGSNKINDDDYIQCGDTLFKICIRSKDEEQRMEPTSKIMPLSIEQTYTDNTVSINSTKFQSMFPEFDITSVDHLTPRQMYAMENLYGLNYKKEIERVSDIPCALFKNHTPLPPHTPINLNFLIDSNNYHINLIIELIMQEPFQLLMSLLPPRQLL